MRPLAERSAFHTQYVSGDKIKKNELGRVCSTYRERRGVYRVLVMKPEGKSTFVKSRRRWKDNIKMDIQEVGLDWIKVAQDRERWLAFVDVVMKLQGCSIK